jgi:DNA gyrase/topoisomerase IV subunit B
MSEIKKLNEFAHARKRTEMYLGARDPQSQKVIEYSPKITSVETKWSPAVFTAFREILDNALDEMTTHGRGDTLKVTYDPKTFVFMIHDNGRGIPISFDKEHGQYAATMAMTETRAGRNFEDRGASRGMNGVGGSIVNMCSEFFDLDIFREGKHFSQRFREGETDLIIEEPIIMPTAAKATGTQIKFKLSPKVFASLILPESFIRARMYEVAMIYPKLKVYYNGKKIDVAKGGVGQTLFADRKPITMTIDIDPENENSKFRAQYWLIPEFFEDGTEHTHSLVNCIPTFHGGTHIDTFRNRFYSGMISALESKSKSKKLTPNKSDFSDGMLIYNVTHMDEPVFDGQAKTRLNNENVAGFIRKAMDDPDFFKGVIRRNPEWIEAVYERCRKRTQKLDDAEVAKAAKKAGRTKVADLEDASGADRSKCILFIAEGKSAVSGMVESRDPKIHGGLPLRGKVLNVFGESNRTIIENEALATIMNSIGLVPGVRANRHQLRYGRVYITTDADEDGKNIAALLVNFFYSLWPELFDPEKAPYIYIFDTPLIIAAKGKDRKYWFADNYDDFSGDSYKSWTITRAKGLAALKKVDWKWVLANPKAQPITDDGELKEAMDLLFNKKRADERKEWIGM